MIIKRLEDKKNIGNEYFNKHDYEKAKIEYLDAYKYLAETKTIIQKDDEEIEVIQKLYLMRCNIILLSNLSLSEIKLNRFY